MNHNVFPDSETCMDMQLGQMPQQNFPNPHGTYFQGSESVFGVARHQASFEHQPPQGPFSGASFGHGLAPLVPVDHTSYLGPRGAVSNPPISTNVAPKPPSRASDGPPGQITLDLQLELPGASKTYGRGKGKGNDRFLPPPPPKRGKGRAATQGMVIAIPHKGRQQALAEQARKRQRYDADESQDDSEDRVLEELTNKTESTELLEPKPKTDSKGKREHHACDRCFRNKTKVEIEFYTGLILLVSPTDRWSTAQ